MGDSSPQKPEAYIVHKGLDGIYVKESKICFIDGKNSKLFYRGYNIDELAETSTYEETAYLLLHGKLPTKNDLNEFDNTIKQNRKLPEQLIKFIQLYPRDGNTMDMLRTAVSALGIYDTSSKTNLEKAVKVMSAITTITSAFERVRRGQPIILPDETLSYAENFLYMLTGEKPNSYDAHVLDIFLILHAEHEMNASTFSCTVTAATLSDMYSALTSGIGTLKGPLHGGANEEALKTILKVGKPENAEPYVKEAISNSQRIMGFGHRVYRNFDPRYTVLKKISRELAERKGKTLIYSTAEAIEDAAVKHLSSIGVFPNVDSYSGLVLNLIEIPTDLFTPIFAISRTAGWSAHILEYLKDNRLIRPKAYYSGELNQKYVAIEKR